MTTSSRSSSKQLVNACWEHSKGNVKELLRIGLAEVQSPATLNFIKVPYGIEAFALEHGARATGFNPGHWLHSLPFLRQKIRSVASRMANG